MIGNLLGLPFFVFLNNGLVYQKKLPIKIKKNRQFIQKTHNIVKYYQPYF